MSSKDHTAFFCGIQVARGLRGSCHPSWWQLLEESARWSVLTFSDWIFKLWYFSWSYFFLRINQWGNFLRLTVKSPRSCLPCLSVCLQYLACDSMASTVCFKVNWEPLAYLDLALTSVYSKYNFFRNWIILLHILLWSQGENFSLKLSLSCLIYSF